MLTEIHIENVGTYRSLNIWQLERVMKIRGPNRHIAILAFGLGMTIKQFKPPLTSNTRCNVPTAD